MELVGGGSLVAYGFTFSLAAEDGSNQIDITCQLVDGLGNPIKAVGIAAMFVIGADTAGDYALGTALTTLSVQTGSLVATALTAGALLVATDAAGQVVLRGTIAGAATRRLNATPWGGLGVPSQSGTITWAA